MDPRVFYVFKAQYGPDELSLYGSFEVYPLLKLGKPYTAFVKDLITYHPFAGHTLGCELQPKLPYATLRHEDRSPVPTYPVGYAFSVKFRQDRVHVLRTHTGIEHRVIRLKRIE